MSKRYIAARIPKDLDASIRNKAEQAGLPVQEWARSELRYIMRESGTLPPDPKTKIDDMTMRSFLIEEQLIAELESLARDTGNTLSSCLRRLLLVITEYRA